MILEELVAMELKARQVALSLYSVLERRNDSCCHRSVQWEHRPPVDSLPVMSSLS